MSRSTLALLLLSAGCEPVEPSGEIFAPTRVEAPASAAPAAPAAAGGELAFPTDEPLKLSSEQMAKNEAEVTLGAAAGVDVDALPGAPAAASPTAAPAAPAAPPAMGLPPASTWPVRLVSTIAQAQPPRAVLGLPDGREQVVAPGSMLAELGLVVMTITTDRVQLARVQPAGDHASIETIEVSAQYPTAPAKP